MLYFLSELNQMSQDEFVEVLGEVFEHTPNIARLTWYKRPFKTMNELHQSMVEVVKNLSEAEQLTLIKAHPDLGTKAKMAESSVAEQTGLGLDRLSVEEYNRLQSLNQTYKNKFNFPFIVAVRNHTKTSLFELFEQRIDNSSEVERAQALDEICKISRLRLGDRVQEND